MTLSELIAELEKHDPTRVLAHGFAKPHSYRGYYECLAFKPAENVTIEAMLNSAREALDRVYCGYKGGEYLMTAHTDCYLAEYGDTGEELTAAHLRHLLSLDEVTRLKAEVATMMGVCDQERANRFEDAKEWRAEVEKLTAEIAAMRALLVQLRTCEFTNDVQENWKNGVIDKVLVKRLENGMRQIVTCPNCTKLETRIEELLRAIVKLTREIPYPEEAENAMRQVGTLTAEIGTLKARLREFEGETFPNDVKIVKGLIVDFNPHTCWGMINIQGQMVKFHSTSFQSHLPTRFPRTYEAVRVTLVRGQVVSVHSDEPRE